MKYFEAKVGAILLAAILGASGLVLPVAAEEGKTTVAVNYHYKTAGQPEPDCQEGDDLRDCRLKVISEGHAVVAKTEVEEGSNVEVGMLAESALAGSGLNLADYKWSRGGTAVSSLGLGDFNEGCEVEGQTVPCINVTAEYTGALAKDTEYYTVKVKMNMSDNVAEDEPEYMWRKEVFSSFELPKLKKDGLTFLGWMAKSADGTWRKIEKVTKSDFGEYDEISVQAVWMGMLEKLGVEFEAGRGAVEAENGSSNSDTVATTASEETTKSDVHAPNTGEFGDVEAGSRPSNVVLYGAMALGVIIGVGVVVVRMQNNHSVKF